MIIQAVNFRNDYQNAILSARCKIRKIGWDEVYLQISSRHQDYVYKDASPFAAMLLLPAMRLGEDLIIKGSISLQLFEGMQTIMAEVLKWDIGLKPIKILADDIKKDNYQADRTATFFSGGVDSFYTYLKHKKDRPKNGRVDSFILVRGFDIDLRDEALWQSTLANIEAIAAAENIELVVIESNIHQLLEPILAWDYAHGGCLAATGLFVRRGFNRIYIPSTFSVDEQVPWGSHLVLDKNWSTEGTAFQHDGTEMTRIEKILSEVSKSPIALRHLKVCYVNKDGAYNCGRCTKCIRTMISFYAAGALEKADTLPHKIDIEYVASQPAARNEGEQIFVGEMQNLQALRQRRLNPPLQAAIESGIAITKAMRRQPASNIKYRLARLAQRMTYVDHLYIRGSLYALYDRLFNRRFVKS